MINALSLYSTEKFAGDYRSRLPAQAVTAKRLETGVSIEATGTLGVEATGTTINKVHVPQGIDVISFQRPYRLGVANVISWLRHHRPELGIIVDIDEDMSPPDTFEHLRRSAALADVLTVSTQALADVFGYDTRRTFVIRNAMPLDCLDNPSTSLSRRRARTVNKDRMIGWSGDAGLSASDLRATGGALAAIVGADRTDGRHVTFRSIGPRGGVAEALSIPGGDTESSGVLPTNLFRIALGEMDFAICPTADPDSGFTRALEFAAAGVPVVATKTFEHEELVGSGMPLWLVSNHKREWTKAVRAMLAFDDKELRDLAHAHRENVRMFHTTDRRVLDWSAAYRTAYQLVRE